jgi:hypothetical protein
MTVANLAATSIVQPVRFRFPGWSDVAKTMPKFDDLLAIEKLADLRAAISRYGVIFSLPQVQRFVSHAESLELQRRFFSHFP